MLTKQENIQKDQIISFLNRYKQFGLSQEENKINYYQTNYRNLFEKYRKCKNVINEIQLKEADEFNIFQILGVAELEAKTHTPFLVNLLNPKGSHAQGALFYNSFIKALEIKENSRLLNIDIEDIEVIAEKSTSNGFIDIFIYHRNKNNRFCIIIENKIYAVDQHQQLERYYNYAINVLKLPSDNIYLIYLKDGREASEDSMNKTLQKDLILKGKLLNISYSEHINNFLCNALLDVQSDNIKHIINQYLKTINNINL